ncbi:unnamed protein product [Phytophthora lilii]|uniref:Unnamed protein product n=1 Tax=Phytophthora lilii TaxID=2077276 RepID=A0A9W6WVP7_9STRA|nr:unnamed protein product [Phytophthora lilii]
MRSFFNSTPTEQELNYPRTVTMRATQVLLATSVALVACSNGFASATETGPKMKTPTVISDKSEKGSAFESASTSMDDDNDIFVYRMPFKYKNYTGTMVITIDKNSLSKASDDSASTDPSVYDFTQLQKSASGSGDEERGLIEFGLTHFAQYKLTQKAVSWFKSIF